MIHWQEHLDIPQLKREIIAVSAQIRALKDEIRSRPEPRDWQRELSRAKVRATLLCAIRAHHRGKLHLRVVTRRHAALGIPMTERFTMEKQEKLIRNAWEELSRQIPLRAAPTPKARQMG